jgi:hypothetical protein
MRTFRHSAGGRVWVVYALEPFTDIPGDETMQRYVIERNVPGAGSLSAEQIRETAQTSNAALSDLGPGIQWVQSHITADRIYCVYLAESAELVHEHARRAGLPATKVSEVTRVVDPMTGN